MSKRNGLLQKEMEKEFRKAKFSPTVKIIDRTYRFEGKENGLPVMIIGQIKGIEYDDALGVSIEVSNRKIREKEIFNFRLIQGKWVLFIRDKITRKEEFFSEGKLALI